MLDAADLFDATLKEEKATEPSEGFRRADGG
jgi:hypothetical protein